MDNKKTMNPAYKVRNLAFETLFANKAGIFKKSVESNYKHFKEFISTALKSSDAKENVIGKYQIIDKSNEYKIKPWIKVQSNQMQSSEGILSEQKDIDLLRKHGIEINNIPIKAIHVRDQNVDFIRVDDITVLIPEIDGEIIVNQDSNIKPDIEKIRPRTVQYMGEEIGVINNSVIIERLKDKVAYDLNYPEIQYHLFKEEDNKNNEIIISLEDDDKSEHSIYEVFFAEDVEEVYFNDNKSITYKIISKNKEYGQLNISVHKSFNEPDEGTIKIKSNTYQLARQDQSIDALMNRPSNYHKPLLNLTDDVSRDGLEDFMRVDEKVKAYKVLTNTKLKGNIAQRKFVNQALQTPDFMILEGPPGSGKTTAILEFIYQAISEGKKILLAASTHVAVDNVLEKMITHENKDEFYELINAVRVGDESNVYVEDVKKFTMSSILGEIPTAYHEMVIDSFNLVCGTTIGILQFPLFKDALQSNQRHKIIEPMFDYLIIDEASKTTFNEFLVPAIFAKRWIIVGDVKQLAPYVEKNDLTPTLISNPPLNNKDVRHAIYFLTMLERESRVNTLFMMTASSIGHVAKYYKQDNLIAITDLVIDGIPTISKHDIVHETFMLSMLSLPNMVVIGEEELVKLALPYLNKDYIVVSNIDDISSEVYFKTYGILHHRHNNFSKSIKDVSDQYSKNLEDEIIWRLIRIYELTNNHDMRGQEHYWQFIESIKKYIPENEHSVYENTLAMLEEIAIPSIITMLQNGIKKKSQATKKTILTDGFTSHHKQNRFVSLEYQYRMHEDISKIPRQYIYNNQALKDDGQLRKSFEYFNNGPRFEIRNVIEPNVYRGRNENEALEIMKELEKFIRSVENQEKTYEIAILSFYNGQVINLRNKLQTRFKSRNKFNFKFSNVRITLNTVDKFQGQEADIVYLSMVQNNKVGFLDSVNRMNVAITRAKNKIVVFGNRKFFKEQKRSILLQQIFN